MTRIHQVYCCSTAVIAHMFRNLIPLVSDRFHIMAASALSSRTSRRVLGETGLWNLGCDCFAF